jgi:hypothetical protein
MIGTTTAAVAEPPLWRATVPVFDAALARLDRTVAKAVAALGPEADAAFVQRPAPRMLPAGQQVATAAQFALRIAYPLAGRRPPEVRGALDAAGLAVRLAETRALLSALAPAEFEGAEARHVRFQAGFADLEMPGEAFLHGFGLPNLYFHHAMAHVALKQAGVRLGKADFDGLHDYPENFSLG